MILDATTNLSVVDGRRDWFPDDRFFTQDYRVLPAGKRMGLRSLVNHW